MRIVHLPMRAVFKQDFFGLTSFLSSSAVTGEVVLGLLIVLSDRECRVPFLISISVFFITYGLPNRI